MKLSDLLTPEGVTVYAVIRDDRTGEAWLDLGTVSYSMSGAADCADASVAPREWKANNQPRGVMQLQIRAEPGVKMQAKPATPARRGRT